MVVAVAQDMERWCARYGPIFRVRLGPTQLLVVADHEVVGTVLHDRPEGLRRSSRLREIGIELGATPGPFSAEGDGRRHPRACLRERAR